MSGLALRKPASSRSCTWVRVRVRVGVRVRVRVRVAGQLAQLHLG